MSKRELIEPTEGDKRYVRRNDDGQNAKTTSKPGEGDEGDGHTGNRKPAK